jgi:hypothetical protein
LSPILNEHLFDSVSSSFFLTSISPSPFAHLRLSLHPTLHFQNAFKVDLS